MVADRTPLVAGNTSMGRNTSAELLDMHRLKVGRRGKEKPASWDPAESVHRLAGDNRDYMASNLDNGRDRLHCWLRGACVHYNRTKACAAAVAGNDLVAVAVADGDSCFDGRNLRCR